MAATAASSLSAAAAAARRSFPSRLRLLARRRRLPFSSTASFSAAAPPAAAASFGWEDALRVAADDRRGDESDLSGYSRKVDTCNRGMVSFLPLPCQPRALERLGCEFRWGFAGQEGGVRGVHGGGSGCGVYPPRVSAVIMFQFGANLFIIRILSSKFCESWGTAIQSTACPGVSIILDRVELCFSAYDQPSQTGYKSLWKRGYKYDRCGGTCVIVTSLIAA